MTEAQQGIVSFLKAKKGQFVRASWGRVCKTRKGSPEVRKVTVTTVRTGIDYNALTAVEAQRASGDLPTEPQPLPWGEWNDFPWTIVHNGQYYLRLYPAVNANTQVQYFMGDESVEYDAIEQYLLATEKREESDQEPLCFTIKMNDLIDIY